MDSFGAVEQLKTAWPEADAMSDERLRYFLDRASAVLRVELPMLAARVQADPSLLALVDGVVTDMVVRVLRNSDGARSRTSTKGPFSESVTYADGVNDLALTDAERRLLSPSATAGTARRRLGSIRLLL